MKPIGKTPYEIRLDLLQLAFDILSHKNLSDDATHGTKEEAHVITTEDVIVEAEKMNLFISKANQPH